jgi:thioredoxin 1
MIELWDFYADWCPPCQQMKPVFEELEKDFAGRVNFQKIDVDKERGKAAKFKVMSVPIFVILKNGQEIDRKVGAVGKEILKNWIEENLP